MTREHSADEMMTISAARMLRNGSICFVGIGLTSKSLQLQLRKNFRSCASGTAKARWLERREKSNPLNKMKNIVASSTKTSVPLTAKEYLESLNDGREVWIYGEKVKDVTKHPAFRNSARMIARLYDGLHDPSKREILTIATEDGGFTHRFYRAPRDAEEQVASRDAIAEWARTTYGWMGR
jgi:hypothetical protein